MKQSGNRHRQTPEKTFASDLRIAETAIADAEVKVTAAQDKPLRSLQAALKNMEKVLSRYEVKLAKHDFPIANRARWKFVDKAQARIRELSPRLETLYTENVRQFCAWCLTDERCFRLRRPRSVAA